MPFRQLADAPASSNTSGGAAITAVQTSVTLQSASGFPAILANGQQSVTILDGGNPAFNPAAPLATPFEYQQINAIAGNVLTFGPGGGAASRVAYAGTTPKAFSSGAPPLCPIIAVGLLAEDIVASVPWKFDDQVLSGASVRVPAAGSIPSSYLGVSWRGIKVRWKVRTTSANSSDTLSMQINGDVGANYRIDVAKVEAGVPSDPEAAGQTAIALAFVPGGAAAPSLYASGSLEIPGAFDAFNKTLQAQSTGADSVLRMWALAGIWFGTAAISFLTFNLTAGSWAAGSYIATELIP